MYCAKAFAVFVILCCSRGSPTADAVTPFPLTQHLLPVGGYAVIYSPRNKAHFVDCKSVAVVFEVVGPDALFNNRQISALVHVTDSNPTPVPLSGMGVLSLTANLLDSEPGTYDISVVVLGPERTPLQQIPPARISITCGTTVGRKSPDDAGRIGALKYQIRIVIVRVCVCVCVCVCVRARAREFVQMCVWDVAGVWCGVQSVRSFSRLRTSVGLSLYAIVT